MRIVAWVRPADRPRTGSWGAHELTPEACLDEAAAAVAGLRVRLGERVVLVLEARFDGLSARHAREQRRYVDS